MGGSPRLFLDILFIGELSSCLSYELISFENVLNDGADAEAIIPLLMGWEGSVGSVQLWASLLKKRCARCWAFVHAMALSTCRAWVPWREHVWELREFCHLCSCSRKGFIRMTGRSFYVLAVPPQDTLQGLPAMGSRPGWDMKAQTTPT